MDLEQLKANIPEFAKDIKLNLSSVLIQSELSEAQIWGVALSCAFMTKSKILIEVLGSEAQQKLSNQESEAAKTAASLMAMTNVYYRFTSLVQDEAYATIPARLRMNALRSHGVDESFFELMCLAVSAIGGCSKCVASHSQKLIESGISREQIMVAVRVASVVQALSVVVGVSL